LTSHSQFRTPATLPTIFHDEPGRMLTQGRQNVCSRL